MALVTIIVWSLSTLCISIKPCKEKGCIIIKGYTIHKCDTLINSFFYVGRCFKSYSKIHDKYVSFTERDVLQSYFCVLPLVPLSVSQNLIIFYCPFICFAESYHILLSHIYAALLMIIFYYLSHISNWSHAICHIFLIGHTLFVTYF